MPWVFSAPLWCRQTCTASGPGTCLYVIIPSYGFQELLIREQISAVSKGPRFMLYRRIYEINTRVWLAELVAAKTIPEATLAAIPESYIDLWRRWQSDAVWLSEAWEPSL